MKAAILGSGDRSSQDSSIINGGGRDLSSADAGTLRRTDGTTPLAERLAKAGDEHSRSQAQGAQDRLEQTRLHDLQIKLMAAIEANPTLRQFKQQIRDDNSRSQAQGAQDRLEQTRLHDLQIKLMAAIEANPTLRQFKQQIRIDSTLMGLRIEIVDSQKRPMFAMSSDHVEPYMRDILREIGKTLNDVPNRIIVQGHTDAVPYAGGEGGYSNWELSADRANASRRELISGGMDEAKVLRVLGLA
ncbi:OmpA family protein, partial [Burkholderia sola]|uniref:OmpA family protein n=1 Tax=Burkholderia sola TaxID=2843302 RepID=UPI0023DDD8B7